MRPYFCRFPSADRKFPLTYRNSSAIMGLVRICALPAGVLSRFFFFRHKIIPQEKTVLATRFRDNAQRAKRKLRRRIMFTSNSL